MRCKNCGRPVARKSDGWPWVHESGEVYCATPIGAMQRMYDDAKKSTVPGA